MHHRFVHEFEDDPPLGDLSVELDPPPGATVEVTVDDDGEVWLSANRRGWLHLARICAEMGLQSDLDPGYHFHRRRDWADSDGAEPGVSCELAGP